MRTVAACALALAAAEARALSLGEAEVRSGLGEPLDLRLPVTLAPGEYIEPSCFKLVTEGEATAPRVAAGRVSLERSAGGTFLRLRTGAPINDASIAVGLIAACRGLPQETRREYVVSVKAKASVASAPSATGRALAAPGPAPEPSSLLPSIATLIARIGDTLQSIARAIFPDNSSARRSYIDALRESNPPLASLDDDAQIPVDTPVALPDLRSISAARHHPSPKPAASGEKSAVAQAPAPAAPAPAPKKQAPAKKAKASAQPAVAPPNRELPTPRASVEPRAAKPAPAPKAKASGDFVLKLSAPTMDLTASRGVDDKTRARLRERLMILDSDDQVSALLALRQNVKELETQVAELRLKVSAMPASFPAPKPAPEPPKAEPPKPEPPKAAPPAVTAPPKAEPPKAEPPKAAPPAVTAPPKVEAPKAEAPKVEPPKAEAPKPSAPPANTAPPIEWLDYALWTLAAIFIAIAVALAMRLRRRGRPEADDDAGTHDLRATAAAKAAGEASRPEPADDAIVVAEELPVDLEVAPDIPPPPALAEAPRREIDADVDLPTNIPTNADDLRRRYIEERFPEIGKGAIHLEDPDSVVKGARLFYEDGALPRAVELLQYAIERNPAELKAWLALFEILRLERLPGEFAELAGRFKAEHGQSDYWPKVQYFGREIDPGNELYREAPINNFETIGPAQAKKIAAAANVDPVTENWLGAPMDFENEVLANELRRGLMSDAGINEPDLVPNPMPALRNIEMFNVA